VSLLDDWTNKQAQFASAAILRAISATQIIKERPGFGQRLIPHLGSVLASPVPASYDPDPDYFFHWFRDSSLVIDALRVAFGQGLVDEKKALEKLREFVDFTRGLQNLNGQKFLQQHDYESSTQPTFLQYLRPKEEIARISNNSIFAETRVNPDGTFDVTRWPRPQMDGPALLILTLLRWLEDSPALDTTLHNNIEKLLIDNLDFTSRYMQEMSFDIWEEEKGFHYYTQLVQREALEKGADWLALQGDSIRANIYRRNRDDLTIQLAAYWDAPLGYLRSRLNVAQGNDDKSLDIAVVFAVIHTARFSGAHSVLDLKVQATITALEELFEAEYLINQRRPDDHGPALGRYKNDAYYSGGAYFFSTLAAAEFYFRLAIALQKGGILRIMPENARFCQRLGVTKETSLKAQIDAARARGDAILRMVQTYTLENGDLSEQFDQKTGAQTSAKHLTWSYGAFITAYAQRHQAAQATQD
jgi:glucoamylase